MKSWKKYLSGAALLAGTLLLPMEKRAQAQQNDEPPKPAAKVLLPIGLSDDQEDNQSPQALQPDERPLTGFQQMTIGTPPERHSYWIAGISYSNSVRSNALTLGGGNNWNSTSYGTGNLSLLQNWSGSQLALNYSGGGVFSTDSVPGNQQFQQLGAVQTFDWRRWQLTILDQFSYLPQSQFGFGTGTGIAMPGVGGPLAPNPPGLQNGFTPDQSVFTVVGPRYSNTFGPQITYMLTPRGSLTLGGVFSILRFIKAGNIETNQAILNAGYSYLVSKTDSLGLLYRFSAFHYINLPLAIGDHIVQATYGKQITGRLALQLAGGPEITNLRNSLGTVTETQSIKGSASANLSYAFVSGNLSLGYIHGVTNGSGVFAGAMSDQITGSASRRLSRVWSGNASLGYARNRSITALAGTQNQNYNTIYAGAGLTRPMGRTINFMLNYTANIQTSNNSTCVGPNCATNFTTHTISVGLSWQTRPIVMR